MPTTNSLLAALCVAIPVALVTPAASAQCATGSCGESETISDLRSALDSAEYAVSSSPLEDAYRQLTQAAADADAVNLDTVAEFRNRLAELARTLQSRSDEALDEAIADYFAGNHEAALTTFESIASLEGLAAARGATRELNLEPSRAEWRSATQRLVDQLDASEFGSARATLIAVNRLAPRTGYRDATQALFAELAASLLPAVLEASDAMDAGNFEPAYATLHHVATLTPLGAPARQAREAMTTHADAPGFQAAQREHEAHQALAAALGRLDTADDVTDALRAQVERELQRVAARFEGTRAAAQAQQQLTSAR